MPPLRPAGQTLLPNERPPAHLQEDGRLKLAWNGFKSGMNFYRLHLLFFTFTPLIASGVFYASNGEYHIPYIDCLFNCVSAMTVTGLATTNLSTLTGWQQAILFILMLCGSPVSVSVVMIAVRRHFFRDKFKHIVAEQSRRRQSLEAKEGRRRRFSFLSGATGRPASNTFQSSATAVDDPKSPAGRAGAFSPDSSSSSTNLFDRIKRLFSGGSSNSSTSSAELEKEEHRIRALIENKERKAQEKEDKRIEREKDKERERNAAHSGGLRTNMIKRVEGEVPMLINPSGHRGGLAIERDETPREELDEQQATNAIAEEKHAGRRVESPTQLDSQPGREDIDAEHVHGPVSPRRSSDVQTSQHSGDAFPRSNTIAFHAHQVGPSHQHVADSSTPTAKHFPRTATIEFGANVGGREDMGQGGTLGRRVNAGGYGGPNFERSATRRSEAAGTIRGPGTSIFPRSTTIRTQARSTKHSGFGGFPMPHELLRQGMAYFFPQVEQRITRTLTMQPTATFASGRSGTGSIAPGKPVPYISFDAVVGRNSQFKDLSSDQLEELGGVEYRALKVLTWVVPCYLLFIQAAGWIIFWPYIAAGGRYNAVFEDQPRFVPIGWFAAFQSVSAFSNTGMSLVDTSMIPFQKAYLMILYIVFLILAGNTAYPIFLRFTIWVISKLAPASSRLHETTRFLLDHPRRCYIYLFPSHQTVFLLLVIVIMMATDWVSFLVLDIGTEAIERIPAGDRVIAGFLQSAAVRAAGFAIVPLASLAPAVKVLYTIMMYVSVYPIAMSVRATNVYEERSLGLFDEEEDDSDEESAFGKADPSENKMVGWTRYLAFHARRQLAFDIWWLGLALWLVCIIERASINNPANESFFNIFAIIFELVSAYGTVGLSLGVSNDNFSLSGAFRPLAKLVVCCVMIRGRHRGLPVAIDRAVMLPNELLQEDKSISQEDQFRRSRRESMHSLSINAQDHHYRRDSSLSLRPRPSVPFFPPAGKDKDESALDDDDDEDDDAAPPPLKTHNQRGSGSSHPPPSAPSHEFASWVGMGGPGTGGVGGGVGGGPGGGSLTPVREVTMSRAPSPESSTMPKQAEEVGGS